MIYFLQCGDSGSIKVGFARDVKTRAACLQIAHHETLSVRHSCEGDKQDEAAAHKFLENLWIRGEWFRPQFKIADVCDVIAVSIRMRKKARKPEPSNFAGTAMEPIERRARIARVSMHDLCHIAKVSPATISRWRNGGTITVKPLKRLEDTLAVMEAK